jgi:Transposase IS4
MRLAGTLSEGSTIFMDRYFTSIPLLDVLHSERLIQATGTLQKSRIPGNSNLQTDKVMAKDGRGSIDQAVRNDGQVSIIKWYDNKPVVLVSSSEGTLPIDECRRWSKKDRAYIQVTHPKLVNSYNTNMGGVDFLDRVISCYRTAARSRKWTVRLIMHMVDFACAAGWIEYRWDQKALGTLRRHILDYLDFKTSIQEELIHSESTEETGDESDDDYDPGFAKNKNRKAHVPHPSAAKRSKLSMHMPEIPLPTKNNRCRYPGCKSNKAKTRCTTCQVFLCLFPERECFRLYHEL